MYTTIVSYSSILLTNTFIMLLGRGILYIQSKTSTSLGPQLPFNYICVSKFNISNWMHNNQANDVTKLCIQRFNFYYYFTLCGQPYKRMQQHALATCTCMVLGGRERKKIFCPPTRHALWHDLVISNLSNQFITMNHYDIITFHVSYKIGSTFT